MEFLFWRINGSALEFINLIKCSWASASLLDVGNVSEYGKNTTTFLIYLFLLLLLARLGGM